MFYVQGPLSCSKATTCYQNLKTTTTHGLMVASVILIHAVVDFAYVPLPVADNIIQFLPSSGPTKCLM